MRLIDADRLSEDIDQAQDSLMTNNDKMWSINKPYFKGLAWAMALINDAPTVNSSGWISAKDGLPTEADGTVLVCFADVFPYNEKEPYPDAKHDRRVSVASYSEFSNRWYGDCGLLPNGVVTHWMPLPQPPKTEED